nr:helix-turn-helix domain-containing protein [Bradyrhizobium sp. dw_411]
MSELLTPTLVKAARALLGYDQAMLAAKTGISKKTLGLIETMDAVPMDARRVRVLQELRTRMEDELGVEFVFAGPGTGEGVRLRR